MGVIGRYMEEEGLPTTHISLIREHTEIIKPPRALWVPFEPGRPFGVPYNSTFQRRVLLAVLKLLEAPSGPVLEDFPEEAPEDEERPTSVAVPAGFPEPIADLGDVEKLRVALREEMASLRPWYDMAVSKRGRTTADASGLDPDEVRAFITKFLDGSMPTSPREDIPAIELLSVAAEDLKAYYSEAVSAQPGQETVDSETLAGWFWRETTAGKVFFTIKEVWKDNDDSMARLATGFVIIPALHQADSPYKSSSEEWLNRGLPGVPTPERR